MQQSLFERYMKLAIMLDTQYRMVSTHTVVSVLLTKLINRTELYHDQTVVWTEYFTCNVTHNLSLFFSNRVCQHEEICRFPSEEFYESKLKTAAKRGPCYLLNKNKLPTAILFGHVYGKEESLVVSTEQGNENSMKNAEEAKQAVSNGGSHNHSGQGWAIN